MERLFDDCKTDQEKADFFLSGEGWASGVIAKGIQNDVSMAYQRCVNFQAALAAKDAEITKLKLICSGEHKDAVRLQAQRDEYREQLSTMTQELERVKLERDELKEKAQCADECYKVLSVNGGKGFTDEMDWKPQTDLGKVCAKTVWQLMKSMEAANTAAGVFMRERDQLKHQLSTLLAKFNTLARHVYTEDGVFGFEDGDTVDTAKGTVYDDLLADAVWAMEATLHYMTLAGFDKRSDSIKRTHAFLSRPDVIEWMERQKEGT